MSTPISYQNLAFDWRPESQSNKKFQLYVIAAIVLACISSIIVSHIQVPKQERRAKTLVPERIAQLVLEKPKPKVESKPKPKPKPKIEQRKPIKKRDEIKKPLTQKQKQARKQAQDSGLLALGSELSDLMDTSDLSAIIGGKVKQEQPEVSQQDINLNRQALIDNASQGSSGLSGEQYASVATVGKRTTLTSRQVAEVKQSLIDKTKPGSAGVGESTKEATSRPGGGSVRAEEEITIVFDKNKSKLYSLYNRARRKNPGLKGKIVLEISIAASGKVTNVRLVSSELGDSKLERSIISRIKQFNFGARKVESIKVTYPIEFLPS